MQKMFPILLIGTVTHLLTHDRNVIINGRKRLTKALDFTVAANINIDGREVPSFLPVKGIGREAENLYRLLMGAGTGDGNGVNVAVFGEYAEEHFTVDGVAQTRQVVKIIRAETIGQDEEMVYDTKHRPRMRYGKATVFLSGNTTGDGKLSSILVADQPVAVGEQRLAMNSKKRVKSADGQGTELVDHVEFINVKGWRDRADSVAGVIKGKALLVEGHLRDDSFTHRDTQQYVQRLCVEVTAVYNRAPLPAARRAQPSRAPAQTQGRQTPARQTPARQTPARQTQPRQTPARSGTATPRFTAPGTRR